MTQPAHAPPSPRPLAPRPSLQVRVELAKKLTSQQLAELTEAFEQADTDSSGFLSIEQLEALLRQASPRPSPLRPAPRRPSLRGGGRRWVPTRAARWRR